MPINLYTSNSLDTLADRLADLARIPADDPLVPITIVVQSRGMERWLSLALAERLGVWGNCRYPFPNKIVEEFFSALLAGGPVNDGFAKEAMAWRVMDFLPRMLKGPGFEPLREYLASDRSQLRLWQLSERIADAFDRYLIYRPEMMLRWERGVEEGWQPRLWRELAGAVPGKHRAALLEDLMDILGRGASPERIALLPRRINIFGISFLPRFHLEVLKGISPFVEINLFFLNPCREYWGDIKSEREQVRLMEKAGREGDFYYEIGNSLLAGMGRSGRDFLWLLLDMDEALNPVEEFADPPGGVIDENGRGTILGLVQADILNMRERGSLFAPPVRYTGDDSIRVASCHGPMREAEALYDYLLSLFDKDPSLEPRDVLVMTPDIQTYAPYLEAVFESPEDDRRRIPCAVADRSAAGESRPVEAFLSLFELAESRYTAPAVMKFLECAEVRRRFGMGEEEARLAVEWTRLAGIRWGLDAGQREAMGLPGTMDHTWRAGLNRLILGYAMEREGLSLYGGLAPLPLDGADAAALGNFLEFIEALFRCCGNLAKPRGLAEWSVLLPEILGELFDAGDDLFPLVVSIRSLAAAGDHYAGDVEPAVVFSILRNDMNREQPGKNFITGKVTVCATLPMRSIPFRVICLLGMNDGEFPRNPFAAGFDLLAEKPRRGDRSVRDEDRYLFLETIISAREKLYLSFTGQSVSDNESIPPSPVVSELLDYLDRAVEITGGVRSRLLAVHPLQGFSPRYFGKGPLTSYSAQRCVAAAALAGARRGRDPFFTAPLPPPEEGVITLDSLAEFFTNPAKALLAGRLGLSFTAEIAPLEGTEPFVIGGLERYRMGNELLLHLSRGEDPGALLAWYRAAGMLPQGTPGDIIFMGLVDEVRAAVDRIGSETGGGLISPLAAEISIGGERLSGVLESLYPAGQVIADLGAGDARRRLRSWLPHLFLNCIDPPVPRRTVLVCRDRAFIMEPVDDARPMLERLVALYRRGMSSPLPYYPKTSFALAEKLFAGKTEGAAVQEAKRQWEGWRLRDGSHRSGEGEESYAGLSSGGEITFDGEFIGISREIFYPLLEHQTEEEF